MADKTQEELLLTDEEILATVEAIPMIASSFLDSIKACYRAVAQAQLSTMDCAKCEARIRSEERERIEKQFIWGQVPYHDIKSGTTKEWTMRCISDEDWQALQSTNKGG